MSGKKRRRRVERGLAGRFSRVWRSYRPFLREKQRKLEDELRSEELRRMMSTARVYPIRCTFDVAEERTWKFTRGLIFAIATHCVPGQFLLTGIRSAGSDGEFLKSNPLDLSSFNAGRDAACPFDFGLATDFIPVEITIESLQPNSWLELELFAHPTLHDDGLTFGLSVLSLGAQTITVDGEA